VKKWEKGEICKCNEFIVWDLYKGSGILVEVEGFLAIVWG